MGHPTTRTPFPSSSRSDSGPFSLIQRARQQQRAHRAGVSRTSVARLSLTASYKAYEFPTLVEYIRALAIRDEADGAEAPLVDLPALPQRAGS